MKNIFLLLSCLMISVLSLAQTNPNHIYVNGYYDSNGNYVSGYYKTAPNSTINDNFSTKPNINPYTGEYGTIEPEYTSGSNLGLTPSEWNDLQEYNRFVEEFHRNPIPKYLEDWVKAEQILSQETEYIDLLEEIRIREEKRAMEERKKEQLAADYQMIQNIYDSSYLKKSEIEYHDRYSYADKIEIERFLNQNGFFNGVVDGIITVETINAIKNLQRFLGVSVDGKMGENTIATAKAKL